MTRMSVRSLIEDERCLPVEQLALIRKIAAEAESLGKPLYLAGGFPRDLLLKRPINDFDLALEGDAVDFGRGLQKKFGGKIVIHSRFGTASWTPSDMVGGIDHFDLITARSESYSSPGELPDVIPSNIEADLRRRDFSINAMAIQLDGDRFGELIDPLNGRADLENGIIQVLHPRSFIEDPTRIFRALRYEFRYQFTLQSSTLELINPESLGVLSKLSGERIRHELDLIFDEDLSLQMIRRAGELGLFRWIHPELPYFNENYADFLEMDDSLDIPADKRMMGYILWFMDSSEQAILSMASRLDFSSDLTHAVWGAAQLKKSLPFLIDSKPSVWTFALEKLPLLSIYAVYLITGIGPLLSFISLWRHVRAHTTGDDLKKRAVPPGPRYGEILHSLRSAWLDGEIQNDIQEQELLAKLLADGR